MNDTATPLPPVEFSFSAEADADTAWIVRRFYLTEALSEPYQAVVEIAVDDPAASSDALLGSNCVVTIKRVDTERRVCGVISVVERLGRTTNQVHVKVTVVPAM